MIFFSLSQLDFPSSPSDILRQLRKKDLTRHNQYTCPVMASYSFGPPFMSLIHPKSINQLYGREEGIDCVVVFKSFVLHGSLSLCLQAAQIGSNQVFGQVAHMAFVFLKVSLLRYPDVSDKGCLEITVTVYLWPC